MPTATVHLNFEQAQFLAGVNAAQARIARFGSAVRGMALFVAGGLAYNIVNATTLDVTKTAHGFTAANVGQRMDWCALSSVGVPQEVAIASIPNANTIRFTTVGNPASGSGTCSLTGWNKIEFNHTGTVATTVNINTRRRDGQEHEDHERSSMLRASSEPKTNDITHHAWNGSARARMSLPSM